MIAEVIGKPPTLEGSGGPPREHGGAFLWGGRFKHSSAGQIPHTVNEEFSFWAFGSCTSLVSCTKSFGPFATYILILHTCSNLGYAAL